MRIIFNKNQYNFKNITNYALLFFKNAIKIRFIIYWFEVIYNITFSKLC